jgi:integrase
MRSHEALYAGLNAILFLALTGARPNEALQARWEQFDLEAGEWRKPAANTKNRTAQTVPLAPEALELLHAIRGAAAMGGDGAGAGEWLFPSPRSGKLPHLTTVKKRWATLCKNADLGDVALYDLRKTFATRLMSQGASVITVQSLTGHKTPTVLLKHYTQVVGDDQRRAVAGLMKPRQKDA